jgi:hypothetical protein
VMEGLWFLSTNEKKEREGACSDQFGARQI